MSQRGSICVLFQLQMTVMPVFGSWFPSAFDVISLVLVQVVQAAAQGINGTIFAYGMK